MQVKRVAAPVNKVRAATAQFLCVLCFTSTVLWCLSYNGAGVEKLVQVKLALGHPYGVRMTSSFHVGDFHANHRKDVDIVPHLRLHVLSSRYAANRPIASRAD